MSSLRKHTRLFQAVSAGLLAAAVFMPSHARAANHALDFDGTDDCVLVAHNDVLNLTNSITIEAWIKPTAAQFADGSGEHWIVRHERWAHATEGGYLLSLTNYGTVTDLHMRFRSNNDQTHQFSSSYEAEAEPGEWAHVAASYDGSFVRLFINGKMVRESSDSFTIGSCTEPLTIGASATGNQGQVEGVIEELRISNVARYTASFDVPTRAFANDGNTVALWHFNEGQGDTTADASGNGLDGTLVNNPTWVDGFPWGEHAEPALEPSDDTVLNNSAAGNNYGASTDFQIDADRHALYRFDVSSLAGTAIIHARLSLYCTDGQQASIGAHRILAGNSGWQEGARDNAAAGAGEPCWNYKDAGATTAWAGGQNGVGIAGTDHRATPEDTVNVTFQTDQRYEWAIRPGLVQSWADDPANNHGVVFLRTSGNSPRFATKEDADETHRPRLEVLCTSPELPKVTITADPDEAFEEGQVPGTFTIKRKALKEDYPLVVNISVRGTAKPVDDYTLTIEEAPDTTPPAVGSTDPAAGEAIVPVSTDVTINFSEPMNTTVTGSAFSMANGGAVTGSITWSPGDTMLTFTPGADLAYGTQYTVTIAATAEDKAGNQIGAPYVFSFTTAAASSLPAPWQNVDVNSATPAGTAGESSGTFTVEGGGGDIWQVTDEFHYAYRALKGDFNLVVRVVSQENTNNWAKCGIMVREAVQGVPRAAFVFVTPGNGIGLYRRDTPDTNYVSAGGVGGVAAPYWLRLVRSGDTFTGDRAPDNSGSPGTWQQVGNSFDITGMPETVYAGLAVTSHNTGSLSTVVFDNLRRFDDTTNPGVSSTDPASGATSVSTSAAVTVTFSEPMDTVRTGQAFSVASGGAVAGSITWSPDDTVLAFTPGSDLACETRYDVTIAATAEDKAGNQMGTPHSFSFTTWAAGRTTVTIPAGWTSVEITVTPEEDLIPEGNETVRINVLQGAGYVQGAAKSATVTIRDNDVPKVTIRKASDAAEPDTTGRFIVERDGEADGDLTVLVSYVVGGTAAPGTDYVSIGTSVTIPQGSLSVAIRVVPKDDSKPEGNETVVVTLSDGADYDLGAEWQATLDIADNDKPVVTIEAETDASEPSTDGNFVVKRTGAVTGDLTVVVSFTVEAESTATQGAGEDYTLGGVVGGTVTIPQGQARADIIVIVEDDDLGEGTETVVVKLGKGPGYRLGAKIKDTVRIVDDEPGVTIAVESGDASEPAVAASFVVRLDRPAPAGGLTVRFAVGGKATEGAGSDYTLTGVVGHTVVIPQDEDQAFITVNPEDDELGEGDETVVVTIDASDQTWGYYAGSPDTDTLIIKDDEPAATVTASVPRAREPSDTGEFTVTLNPWVGAEEMTVYYTVNGTATPKSDFEDLGDKVTIPVGKTQATITVTPIDDFRLDGGETVVVRLDGSDQTWGYYVGSPGSATVTIDDDERGGIGGGTGGCAPGPGCGIAWVLLGVAALAGRGRRRR